MELKEKYLENPSQCPFCNSDDIEGGSFECDSKDAWQPVTCHDCGKEWDDIYKLVDVKFH